MKNLVTRRNFIQQSLMAGICISMSKPSSLVSMSNQDLLRLGLVTYQWGKDWDLPSLIANCEKTGYLAVELRTQHAHGVETSLNQAERKEVKKRFADSAVTCVGYGSNFEYHSANAANLRENIEQTKQYIQLCHDIGATGIKVKPNTLPKDVPREKTIAQIASSLNEVGKYAQDFGQLVRVEVHGPITAEIPNMKAIFDQVTEKNVKICWNSNDLDLASPGFTKNFDMLKEWIGDTVHVRQFNIDEYPYLELFKSLVSINFKGWLLLEAGNEVPDRLAGLKEQRVLFEELIKSVKNG